jgi:hypothetical protein
MSKNFPTNIIVRKYIIAENTLTDVLTTIPYCKEHELVWSPALSTVIQEACSILASLWKYEAKQSPCVTKTKLDIKDYYNYFSTKVALKRVIFWGHETELIYPFYNWNGAQYAQLSWWNAYNNLKHDLVKNIKHSTLVNAVYSMAGLFIAIITCEYCTEHIVEEGWVSSPHPNLIASLRDDFQDAHLNYCVVESRLYSYPIGFDNKQITPEWTWTGPASPRFINWFNNYSD